MGKKKDKQGYCLVWVDADGKYHLKPCIGKIATERAVMDITGCQWYDIFEDDGIFGEWKTQELSDRLELAPAGSDFQIIFRSLFMLFDQYKKDIQGQVTEMKMMRTARLIEDVNAIMKELRDMGAK